jgi:CxxC motif-containing protein (DUF1111 family)
VHALFTVSGRGEAGPCALEQPNFAREMARRNVVFRIPTPTFGAGLMEMIPDSAILANQRANSGAKAALGIRGRANFHLAGRTISGQTNNNGNDGTVARFGWKAQNKSLLLFSGEAYNVEMGITNDLFMTERDEDPNCEYADHPNSITDPDAGSPIDAINSIEKFTFFMRFLAPPTPSETEPGGAESIATGKSLFTAVGCVQCHTVVHDRQVSGRGLAVQTRSALLGPVGPRHGGRVGRWREPGRSQRSGVPHGAAVGTRATHLPPPRRAHVGPGRGDPRARQQGIGGQWKRGLV